MSGEYASSEPVLIETGRLEPDSVPCGPALPRPFRGTCCERAEHMECESTFAALTLAAERLERLLDREIALLTRHDPIRLGDINNMKSRGLLELGRIMNALQACNLSALGLDVEKPLGRLREKLDQNRQILGIHLRAVREIASVVAQTIQEHESDGTYGVTTGRAGDRR